MPVLYKIRLQVVAAAEDDGSNAPGITAASFALKLPTLNQIFSKATIQFLFDPDADFLKINSSLLSRDFTLLEEPNLPGDQWDHDPLKDVDSHVLAREALACSLAGKLVLFYHNRVQTKQNKATGAWSLVIKEGGAAGWNGYYVDMSPSSQAKDLGHELGHYLQMPHTHHHAPQTVGDAAKFIQDHVEQGNPQKDGLEILDGDRDWVLDTPADAGPGIFDSLDLERCGRVGEIPIPVMFAGGASQTYTLKPDRTLVMSYFKDCDWSMTISKQQAQRVRDGLEQRQHRDLISAKASTGYEIKRGGSASAGAVGSVSAALVRFGRVMTAVRDGSNKLKVIVWSVSTNGQTVSRLGDAGGDISFFISACSLGLEMAATAINNSGKLEVIAWKVNLLGTPKRLGSAMRDGGMTDVAASWITRNHLVTASRLMNGNLRMDVWYIPADGSVTHKASASAGKVNAEIVDFPTPGLTLCEVGYACTALSVRDGSGKLKTILWRYDPEAEKLVRVGHSDLAQSPVGWIEICSPGRENAVAAYQDASGNLALQGYRFPEDGAFILAAGSAAGGKIDDVAICRLGVHMTVTGVKAANGKLKLTLWRTTPALQGFQVLNEVTTQESFSRLALVQTGIRQFVSVLRDGGGDLKLIAWNVKLPAGLAPPLGDTFAGVPAVDDLLDGNCGVVEAPVLGKAGPRSIFPPRRG